MIADQLLNLVAHALLAAFRPLTVHAFLLRVGRLLRVRRSPEQARNVEAMLAGRGTCLSRAMTIAATTPGAEVVIGVQRDGPPRALAHAWVELEGSPLGSLDPSWREIARLAP